MVSIPTCQFCGPLNLFHSPTGSFKNAFKSLIAASARKAATNAAAAYGAIPSNSGVISVPIANGRLADKANVANAARSAAWSGASSKMVTAALNAPLRISQMRVPTSAKIFPHSMFLSISPMSCPTASQSVSLTALISS